LSGGVGGRGGEQYPIIGGSGGYGGNPGQAGWPGNPGFIVGIGSLTAGGPGGNPGAAIDGYSYVTIVTSGDIRGPLNN
jgi:hypothetical protein